MKDVRTGTESQWQRKRVFIRTYGCQMNVYDSDRMADVLRPLGYALSDSPEQADLVVLNTCHIRERASEKVYSELGRLRDLKVDRRRDGSDLTIAVAGCVAQAEGEEIVQRQPAVDIVVGPQAYHRLPELLARVARKSDERRFDGLRRPGAGPSRGSANFPGHAAMASRFARPIVIVIVVVGALCGRAEEPAASVAWLVTLCTPSAIGLEGAME